MRIRVYLWVSVHRVRLCADGHALVQGIATQLGATGRHQTRQARRHCGIQTKRLADDLVQVRQVLEILLVKVVGQELQLLEQDGPNQGVAAHGPHEVGERNGRGVAAADDVHLGLVPHLLKGEPVVFLGLEQVGEEGLLRELGRRLDHLFVPAQRLARVFSQGAGVAHGFAEIWQRDLGGDGGEERERGAHDAEVASLPQHAHVVVSLQSLDWRQMVPCA